jgi:predicted restriction endonuclease
MIGSLPEDRSILDPMHIVNKSQGGLGVIQNGVIGCRWHHSLMDNGRYGPEMRRMAEDYLKILYPGWTPESVTYSKWRDFKYRK